MDFGAQFSLSMEKKWPASKNLINFMISNTGCPCENVEPSGKNVYKSRSLMIGQSNGLVIEKFHSIFLIKIKSKKHRLSLFTLVSYKICTKIKETIHHTFPYVCIKIFV